MYVRVITHAPMLDAHYPHPHPHAPSTSTPTLSTPQALEKNNDLPHLFGRFAANDFIGMSQSVMNSFQVRMAAMDGIGYNNKGAHVTSDANLIFL